VPLRVTPESWQKTLLPSLKAFVMRGVSTYCGFFVLEETENASAPFTKIACGGFTSPVSVILADKAGRASLKDERFHSRVCIVSRVFIVVDYLCYDRPSHQ
jgi:hypothetical protein